MVGAEQLPLDQMAVEVPTRDGRAAARVVAAQVAGALVVAAGARVVAGSRGQIGRASCRERVSSPV